jgi:fatty acid desaturase
VRGAHLRERPRRRRPARPLIPPAPLAPTVCPGAPAGDFPTRPASPVAARFDLTDEQLDQFGQELDAIRTRIMEDLGAEDVEYLRRMLALQHGLEVTGRATLLASWFPPFWLLGTGALALSKILDNMEIGHNVMHGQYDWTRDPALASDTFDWDTACPADQWRHSHNVQHHTWTNVHGRDRDIGYGVLRMSPDQRWHPHNLLNPLYATGLAFLFQYGVMLHDVEADRIVAGKRTWEEAWPVLREGLAKSGRQGLRDYVLWPALSGPSFVPTLLANATANAIRNVWSFSIIFCGHFPSGVQEFTEEEVEGESRGQWYLRQMTGSANITGGPVFHVLSGNLSHQIEHHLFPDLPARRYAEISGEVRDICDRYGLPYNARSFSKQFGSVVGKITRFALPWT